MYKVDCTEKEAKDLGEKRWMNKNKWRYFLWIMLPLAAAALVAFISAPGALNIPDWVSAPIIFVALMISMFALWRGSRACTKAGREFAQSLKPEEK